MFVKHLEEQNFFDAGFSLNPLSRETFSKQSIDAESISTYVQVWMDVNSYKYKAVTDKEGTVEYGSIRNKEDLSEINRRFFVDHKKEFLIRQLIPLVDERIQMDTIQRTILLKLIQKSQENEVDILIKKTLGVNCEET